MTDSEAKNLINSFSEEQKAEFNTLCRNKLHSIDTGELTQSELDDVNGVVEHLEAKSQEDIDADIDTALNTGNKLSSRPC